MRSVRKSPAVFLALVFLCSLLAACEGSTTQPALAFSHTETPAAADTPQATTAAAQAPSPEPAPTPSPTPEITPSPSPSKALSPTPSPTPTAKPYTKLYKIYVEKGSHTLTVYKRGSDGNYTKAVKTFLTSIGHGKNTTPSGTFTIISRERWHFFHVSWTQYCMKYYHSTFDMFIHAPYYWKKDNNTVREDRYDAIGTDETDGCLLMNTDAAKWIYDNCENGTMIEIVNGNPRGTKATPKPSLPPGQTYDPTDPDIPAPTAAPELAASPSPAPTPTPALTPTPEP